MPKKPGFTLAQHKKWGRRLYRIKAALDDLYGDMCPAYPFKDKAFTHLGHARSRIDELRSALDDMVYAENRARTNNENARIYYCGPELREEREERKSKKAHQA